MRKKMIIKWALVILWGIAGILNLISKGKVSKTSYGLCWGCFMLYLIARLFE